MEEKLLEKLDKLKDELTAMGKVAVAYSGGVDSTFLLYVAKQTIPDGVIAITVNSHSFPNREFDETVKFCKDNAIKQVVLKINELDNEEFVKNPPNRCYICKKRYFSSILEAAKNNSALYVLDGSNTDDTGDYRPGMQAIKELGIVSPLMKCGFNKSDIRTLSKHFGIYTWDKPAYACLSTRFPYGERITEEKLKMVEEAEYILIENGFRQMRVRIHDDMARIEVPKENIEAFLNSELRELIVSKFESIGFKYVALDLKGYRMGSMNEKLEQTSKI